MDNNQAQNQQQGTQQNHAQQQAGGATPQYVFSDNNANDSGFTQTFAMGADGQVNQPQQMQAQGQQPIAQPHYQQPVQLGAQQPVLQPIPQPIPQAQPMMQQQYQQPIAQPQMMPPQVNQMPPQQAFTPQPAGQMSQQQMQTQGQQPAMQQFGTGGTPVTPPAYAQGGGDQAQAGDQVQEEEDKTPANYQLGQYVKPTRSITLPAHNLQFDEAKFLSLLAGSISLSKDEKKKIIASIPKLRQQQIDELIRIFEEERSKFAELSEKHVGQLEKLAKEHAADWEDIEMEYAAESKKENEAAEADEIRKQLGL